MLTDQQRADLAAQAAHYDRRAAHYEQESIKLQDWRRRRVEQIEAKAERRGEATPYVTADPASVAHSWVGDDPKLNEYGAGMVIVERRAQMYSQMATSAKMTLMLDAFAAGINVTGSFSR